MNNLGPEPAQDTTALRKPAVADTPTILLAPDKFKGSATAAQVAEALAQGIRATASEARLVHCPIADGGDGTVDAALAAGYSERTATVTGPTGAARTARWAHDTATDTAVVELAETVGLQALPHGDLAARTASTRGLGELILAAIHGGACTVMVGLGGSASTDLGSGLLQGLGARLNDDVGTDIAPGLDGLAHLSTADLAPARDALDGVELIIAGDVTNPLLGAQGAAAVFGPQKGLTPGEIDEADRTLEHAAAVLDPRGSIRDRPGAGAAGGAGFALHLLGATPRSGADAVMELVGFDEHLRRCRLVVTGEGALDQQTLQGKGPAEVAGRAADRGLPVIAVAGTVRLDSDTLREAGIVRTWDLVSRAESRTDAIERTVPLLEDVGREIGENLHEILARHAQSRA